MGKALKPGVRIIAGKRIDLVELRKRRKLAREHAAPVEDTRVSDMWARDDARILSARRDAVEASTIAKLPPKVPVSSNAVENPLYMRDHDGETTNHRLITVPFNHKESAIGTMMARKLLDEAQAMAAANFRRLWETLGGKGAPAIDYSKEPVDGGKIAEPIDLRQMQAGIELKRCRELLGERGYKLVSQVCGEGFQISELVDGKRAQLSLMDALRGFLDDLGGMWGYSNRAQRKISAVRK